MKTLTFTFLFFLSALLVAQINSRTRWGNVSDEEFAFKQVFFEADSDAVILWESGYMDLKFPMETTVYRRIKILTEQGKSYANQRFVFQHYDKLENISNIKAQTINQENGKAVTYSVKRSDIHFNKLNDYFTEVVFTFPNVQVGSIIEFEYFTSRKNMNWIEAWQFQHEIPTIFSQVRINPESSYSGFSAIALGENFSKNSKKEVTGGNVSVYTLKNLPSYTTHKFVYNQESLADKLLLQLKSYYDYKDTYSGDQVVLKERNITWASLSKDMYQSHRTFLWQGAVKKILMTIPKGSSQKEYLQNIVNHFKVNYQWNKMNMITGLPLQTNQEVLNTKTGNNADLNTLLYTFLSEAGLKTEYVIASSRNRGLLITAYPYKGQFDTSFNFVTLDNGETFLIDASDLSNGLGYMPLKNYNQLGLVLNPQSEKFINVEPPLTEIYISQNYNFIENKVNFAQNEKKRGYFQNHSLEKNPPLIDLHFEEKESPSPQFGEDQYWISRRIFEADFEQKNIFTIQNPMLKLLKSYQFTQENRDIPVELDFPYVYKVQVSFKIPNDYKAEIPTNFNSTQIDKNQNLSYSQKAVTKGQTLTIIYELIIKKSVLSNQYAEVKSFFNSCNSSANETIYLNKI